MTLERREPLKRKNPLARGDSQLKRTRIRPVSKKRAKVNRERAKVVARIATIRPMCAWPDCRRLGEHPHEIWTRARSGQSDHGLLCPDNIVLLCPEHHDHSREDELREHGLIRWSHEGCPCGFPGNQPTVTGRIEHL